MEHLLTLLKTNSSFSIPSVSLVQKSNEPNVLSCCLKLFTPWIIDLGAFDHMTSSSHLFESYSPCSGNENVRIVNGSFSSIAGKGLKISERMILNLFMFLNLLAISCP